MTDGALWAKTENPKVNMTLIMFLILKNIILYILVDLYIVIL